MRNRLLVLVVAFIVALAGSSAFADIIDQSQTGYDYQARVYNLRSECQTFTAGLSGDLVKVGVFLTEENSSYDQLAPATISIVGTTGIDSHPNDANVLWTQSYSTLAQGWFDVDTSALAPTLTAGTVYGIKITSTDSSSSLPNDAWDYDREHNLYPNGQLWDNSSGSWAKQAISGNPETAPDAAFQTYMNAVPEPATMTLLFVGGLAAVARRIRLRFKS